MLLSIGQFTSLEVLFIVQVAALSGGENQQLRMLPFTSRLVQIVAGQKLFLEENIVKN